MFFSVEQEVLNDALSNVSKAVADRSAITALEGIKFSVEPGKLTLTGYDLEIGIKTTIAADSNINTEFVLSAKLVCQMISKLPQCTVRFEIITGDTFSVRITGKKIVTTFGAISAEEYPNVPDYERENGFLIDAAILKNMINMTKFAVAVSDQKPILTGELFEMENGVMNLVSLDGYRLAIRTETVNIPQNARFVIKLKSLLDIVSLIKDKKSDESNNIRVFVSARSAAFEFDNIFIHTRLLEGEFHQYRRAIPTADRVKSTVRVDVPELIRALERCQLLVDEKVKSPVRLTMKSDHIDINCRTPRGELSDDVSCTLDGEELEIGFNASYLISALKSAETDVVIFKLIDGVSPMIVSPVEGDSFLFLVLPIRLY